MAKSRRVILGINDCYRRSSADNSSSKEIWWTFTFFFVNIKPCIYWANYTPVITISIRIRHTFASLGVIVPSFSNIALGATISIRNKSFCAITCLILNVICCILWAFWASYCIYSIFYWKESFFANTFLSWSIINIILSQLTYINCLHCMRSTRTIFVLCVCSTVFL
jgi:hypothetical protein